MLKKRQNLAELEHRLCERIDDVARLLTRNHAEKFEVNKKFRLIEKRIESLLEIFVLQVGENEQNVRQIINSIVKNSQKLKNPNSLLTHIRSHQNLNNQEEATPAYNSQEEER